MRLWSLHPSYLDSKGLVALWREGLLARKVLHGNTKGYTHHPQLLRFKQAANPLVAIDVYLEAVIKEATKRNYTFDSSKITLGLSTPRITVTDGQLHHELAHLKEKLMVRDPKLAAALLQITTPQPHPLFQPVTGAVEQWERVTDRLDSHQ